MRKNHQRRHLRQETFTRQINASDELWKRFNLLISKVDFDELFCNLSTCQMLDAFYEVVVHNVDIIFDKKEKLKESDSFSSANKIPRNVGFL